MNNRLGDGKSITYSNTGSAISAGDVVIMGDTIGVAAVDIAATTGVGEVYIDGEFTLPKLTAAVITVGQRMMWDVTGGGFDDDAATPASGDISNGAIAMEGAGSGVLTIKARLTPGGTAT